MTVDTERSHAYGYSDQGYQCITIGSCQTNLMQPNVFHTASLFNVGPVKNIKTIVLHCIVLYCIEK